MIETSRRGVAYDFDGTIISTLEQHEAAWRHAGGELGVTIDEDFLINQKGRTNEEAGKLIFGDDTEKIGRFVALKAQFVIDHTGDMPVYDGFFETVQALQQDAIPVMICTSADQAFVDKVFQADERFEVFKDLTITREMYEHGKPNPEPLLLTYEKMGIAPENAVYVGDALSDYQAAVAAGCTFVYFCPDPDRRDSRIPEDIMTIANHSEILGLFNSSNH